jgi:hypothetical protein
MRVELSFQNELKGPEPEPKRKPGDRPPRVPPPDWSRHPTNPIPDGGS